MINLIDEICEEFKNTKFAKMGGSCFECCDYEDMYVELKDFLRAALTKALARQREEILGRWPEKADHTRRGKNKNHINDEFYGCCECWEDKNFNAALDKCRKAVEGK